MEYVTLGRTGLRVSVAGLGCGGHSRLGQRRGAMFEHSVDIVRRALDLGITFVDTAEAYGTETIVGRAIEGRREEVVLSTKGFVRDTPDELEAALDASLERLGTSYVDVYHLHGVLEEQYDHVVSVLLPVLERMRERGKLRHIGLTERFATDTGHEMLPRALRDDCWDVVMVGFNILNQSARERVFPLTAAEGIGTLVMFAVRRALRSLKDADAGLGFLLRSADSLPDAAYRFCRHTPGVDVVLTGTGNVDHLEENVRSLGKPPLPADDTARLLELFGGMDHLSGN